MSSYLIRRHQLPANPLQRAVFISTRDWRVSAFALVAVSALMIVLSGRAHADEYTGQSKDDPKELISIPSHESHMQTQTISSIFMPMPGWAGGMNNLSMPDVLSPNGKKKEVASTKAQPLAPPKDTPAVFTPKPEVTEAPKQPDAPALITVSPFLQWVKSNPQAVAEAKAQAVASNPAPAATGPIPATGAPGATPTDPYWLPPMIDSSSMTPGSSAAIYTTPQRQ